MTGPARADWGPVLYVHDIGGDPTARERFLSQGRLTGARTMHLRGHGPARWVRGAYYDLAGFADDVARVLRERAAEPTTLVGAGLGGLVCAAVAAALPDHVAALHLVSGDAGDGDESNAPWSQRFVFTDAPADEPLEPNPAWLVGVSRLGSAPRTGGLATSDDPALALGPPVPVRRAELRARVAGLQAPWRGHRSWFTALFP